MKIRKKTPSAGAPADAVQEFAAALGNPFPGIELFDRIGDIVFFIKDQEARYVAVSETLVLRCKVAGKRAL
ncbi:MAG: hypothetical protein JO312_17420, partial [Hyphomicrobiales bacterium]|nr:hypothetical protein [Hyphomicrobiales bacterium]